MEAYCIVIIIKDHREKERERDSGGILDELMVL